MHELRAVESRQSLGIGVVGDHQRNVAVQLARLVPVEQVGEAVVVLRNQNAHARTPLAFGQPPAHLKARGNRGELIGQLVQAHVHPGGIELHPHQEQAGLGVAMLVGVQNVSIVAEDEIGDHRHQTLAVRATDQQHCGTATL